MTHSLTISLSLSFLTLAACGGGSGSAVDAQPTTNPATLWLAPNNSELAVKLVGTEPPPY